MVIITGVKQQHSAEPIVINEKCRFGPRVQLIAPKANVKTSSKDPGAAHDERATENGRTLFNVALPIPGLTITKPITPNGNVRLSCNTHPWMRGWMVVTKRSGGGERHRWPLYTDNVPPGTYELQVWHEALKGVPHPSQDFEYNIFISYRRGDGLQIAEWLSRRLRAYRPPRGFPRTLTPLRVYRDVERERVTPAIWEERIRPALVGSRFMIVVLTDSVAAPPPGAVNWVIREVSGFLETPQGSNVMIVRAGPRVPLPPEIAAHFPDPGWLDVQPSHLRWWRRLVTRGTLQDKVSALVVPALDISDAEIPRLTQLAEREKRRCVGDRCRIRCAGAGRHYACGCGVEIPGHCRTPSGNSSHSEKRRRVQPHRGSAPVVDAAGARPSRRDNRRSNSTRAYTVEHGAVGSSTLGVERRVHA